jgi:hypothetical protein
MPQSAASLVRIWRESTSQRRDHDQTMEDKTFLEYIREARSPDTEIDEGLVALFLEGTDRSTTCARHLDLLAGFVGTTCTKQLREGRCPHDLPKIALLDDLCTENNIQRRHRPGPLNVPELCRLLEQPVSRHMPVSCVSCRWHWTDDVERLSDSLMLRRMMPNHLSNQIC